MSESLADRWARMNEAELREEVFRFYRAQGMMQARLYEQIENLERRIHQQRKELIAAAEKRHDMAIQIAELKSRVNEQTTPTAADDRMLYGTSFERKRQDGTLERIDPTEIIIRKR